MVSIHHFRLKIETIDWQIHNAYILLKIEF
jgi:hypothetical protein